MNAKLLLFFAKRVCFFVWESKKGRVLIFKNEKGGMPKKKGRVSGSTLLNGSRRSPDVLW